MLTATSMSLRGRTLLVIGATFAALGLMLYGTLRESALPELVLHEETDARETAARGARLLLQEVERVATVAADEAKRPQTREAIAGRRPAFTDLPDTVKREVGLMALVARDGRLVGTWYVDPATKEPDTPPGDLFASLLHLPALAVSHPGDENLKGIAVVTSGAVLVATEPVPNPADPTHPLGRLVAGRLLDHIEVRRLGTLAQAQIAIAPANDTRNSADFAPAVGRLSADAPSLVRPLSPDRLAAFTFLPGIEPQQGLVVRAEVPRPLYGQGLVVQRFLLMSALLMVLMVGLLVSLLLQQTVVAPVTRLSAAVQQIGRSADLSQRVPAFGRDEVGRLAEAINEMLLSLEQARHAREDTEGRYRAVVEQVTESILLVDVATRQVLDANPSACTLLGYSPEEMEGLTLYDIVSAERNSVDTNIDRTLLLRRYFVGERVYHTKHGATVEVEVSGTALSLQGRDVLCVMLRDIRGRKRAEAQRRRLETQLRQAEKLRSVGVLAGGIAHDFNNLLMAMLGNAELAIMRLPEGSAALGPVRNIQSAGNRAADLTRQIMTYSGAGSYEFGSVSINAVVADVLAGLAAELPPHVQVEADTPDDLPNIVGDAGQIAQAVNGLVSNAVEALGDEPGQVTVRCRLEQVSAAWLADTLLPQGLQAGEYVAIEVVDTGCGMTPETLQRVFEPFFTTKFTGRGLGLPATLGIARAHGGTVHVTSEAGHGSTFTMLLPTTGRPSAAAAVEEDRAVAAPIHSSTVLVVDDEELVRHVTQGMLAMAGFDSLAAASGEEAVELLRVQPEQIRFAVLDLTMPGMGGAEALRQMRGLRPDLPVLLSSGHDEEHAMAQFAERERVAFLAKPYGYDDLCAAIAVVCEQTD